MNCKICGNRWEEGILIGISFFYKIIKMGVIYDFRYNLLKNLFDEFFLSILYSVIIVFFEVECNFCLKID